VKDPSAPPWGTPSEKVRLFPETVPDTVPVARAPVPLSVSDNVPENDVPDWVNDQVMSPDPDESVAVPDQEPVTFAGEGEGAVGVVDPDDEELPPPLQPSAALATTIAAAARRRGNRVRIMSEAGRILARPSSVHWSGHTVWNATRGTNRTRGVAPC